MQDKVKYWLEMSGYYLELYQPFREYKTIAEMDKRQAIILAKEYKRVVSDTKIFARQGYLFKI